MLWKCPKCKKEFKNKNQWHSCAKVDVAKHVEGVPADHKAAYEKLLSEVSTWENVTLNPVVSGIQVKSVSTFLSIAFKKDYMKVEFYHTSEIQEAVILKTLKISKNRIVHCVAIQSPKDVNAQLMKWMRGSYNIITGG